MKDLFLRDVEELLGREERKSLMRSSAVLASGGIRIYCGHRVESCDGLRPVLIVVKKRKRPDKGPRRRTLRLVGGRL